MTREKISEFQAEVGAWFASNAFKILAYAITLGIAYGAMNSKLTAVIDEQHNAAEHLARTDSARMRTESAQLSMAADLHVLRILACEGNSQDTYCRNTLP